MKVNRRELVKASMLGTALMAIDPWKILASSQIPGGLSRKAYRTTTLEGKWKLTNIDGDLPELSGELLRVGPGQKETQGTKLRHFFDGDAYLNRFHFTHHGVELTAHFIQTPERLEEIKKGKMIYDEFGTEAPRSTYKRKNQPNISLIQWQDYYLALSEGGKPARLGKDLNFATYHTFKKSLRNNIGFTAHTKYDPKSGKSYAFGIVQGLSKALVVYEMDPVTNRLKVLYKLNQKKIHMIHDMMITENHILFVISPCTFKMMDIMLDKGSLAEAIEYHSNMGTRILVLDKNGREKPRTIEADSALCFHNGNAWEEDGKIFCSTFLAKDETLLKDIHNWTYKSKKQNFVETTNLNFLEIDHKRSSMKNHGEALVSHDFPTFNKTLIGQKTRFTYATKLGEQSDLIAMRGVTKLDHHHGGELHYVFPSNEMNGESVYIPGANKTEDDGHLLIPGYNETRDESFLEVVTARDMKFRARIWMDAYFPVGFHGHWYQS